MFAESRTRTVHTSSCRRCFVLSGDVSGQQTQSVLRLREYLHRCGGRCQYNTFRSCGLFFPSCSYIPRPDPHFYRPAGLHKKRYSVFRSQRQEHRNDQRGYRHADHLCPGCQRQVREVISGSSYRMEQRRVQQDCPDYRIRRIGQERRKSPLALSPVRSSPEPEYPLEHYGEITGKKIGQSTDSDGSGAVAVRRNHAAPVKSSSMEGAA